MNALPTQMLKRRGLDLLRLSLQAALWAGVWLMASASISYAELGQVHPFVLEKLPLAHPQLYWTALWIHVPSALFSLTACLLLIVAPLRRRFPAFHRWLGRLTGALLLGAVVPSGMYLACFAQGGLVTTLGFWVTGLIACGAMLKSIQSARRRDMRAHRRFSGHVLAQLSVAVTSRFLLIGAETLGFYDTWAYTAALWVPVVGGVLAVEWWTGRRSPSTTKGTGHEAIALVSHLDVVR